MGHSTSPSEYGRINNAIFDTMPLTRGRNQLLFSVAGCWAGVPQRSSRRYKPRLTLRPIRRRRHVVSRVTWPCHVTLSQVRGTLAPRKHDMLSVHDRDRCSVYCIYKQLTGWHSGPTVTSNGSPYAKGPLSCLSVCNVDVLWPNGWIHHDAT